MTETARLAPPSLDVPLLLTDEQTELRAVLRSFLADSSPESVVRRHMDTVDGLDLGTWKGLSADLGVCGLAVPEELGGSGGSFGDVAVVTEELGRTLSCVPWLSNLVLAQSLLLGLTGHPLADECLATVAEGRARATVAFAEQGRPWSPMGVAITAERSATGWRLSGAKDYVVDGHTADLVLVLARTGAGLTAFVVESDAPGLNRVPVPTMDLTRKQARLEFADVPAQVLGEEGGAEEAFVRMLDLAAIAIAQECVGGAQFVLDSAVDYAKTRYQFGRAIGSFQAIKHKCADMLLAVESAKSAAYYARGVVSSGADAGIPLAAALAKSACQDAYLNCASENIQVHGGIGFTWEHSAHLYFKRAQANSLMFGSSRYHRARLGDLLGI
ncbi:acyl-CoA dehydrogenase family protein [Streptomyces sp. NPDC002758]